MKQKTTWTPSRNLPRIFCLAPGLVLLGSIAVGAQTVASQIYKDASPSVVFIKTDSGAGTGFLVSSDGLIATSYHVIDGAKSVGVKTLAGDIYDDVFLIAKDERKDIALLKINGFDLKSLELGNSNVVSPGDKVIVLGNPLGSERLQASVTDGIVSGVRDLDEGFKVIQISAPISPGNSGGPIFDEGGKVIGIAAFKLTRGENLNFAIPINYLRGMLGGPPNSPIGQWKSGEVGKGIFSESPLNSLSGRWKGTHGNLYLVNDTGGRVNVLNLTWTHFTYDLKWIDGLVVGKVFGVGWRGRGVQGFVLRVDEDNRLAEGTFDWKDSDSEEVILKKARKSIEKVRFYWIRFD